MRWLAKLFRHGALVGFACVLAAVTVMELYVLISSWLSGAFDRSFPDCDPCGLIGYAGRALIVIFTVVSTVGLLAAAAGWIVQQAIRRLRTR